MQPDLSDRPAQALKGTGRSPTPELLPCGKKITTTATCPDYPVRQPLVEIQNPAGHQSTKRKFITLPSRAKCWKHIKQHRGGIGTARCVQHMTRLPTQPQTRSTQSYYLPAAGNIKAAPASHISSGKPYTFSTKPDFTQDKKKSSNSGPTTSTHSYTENQQAHSKSQRKPSSPESTTYQHRSLTSIKSPVPSTHLALPDPESSPPDSAIADLWPTVRAHIAMQINSLATKEPLSENATPRSDGEDRLVIEMERCIIGGDSAIQTSHCTQNFTDDTAKEVARYISDTRELNLPLRSNLLVGLMWTLFPVAAQATNVPDQLASSNSSFDVPIPSVSQIVVARQAEADENESILRLSYSLDAEKTWKGKLPAGYDVLLKLAGVLNEHSLCSEFLSIWVGLSEVSSNTISNRARKALKEQLMIHRRDGPDDGRASLMDLRYYGYHVVGTKMQIWKLECEARDQSQSSHPSKDIAAGSTDRKAPLVRTPAVAAASLTNHGARTLGKGAFTRGARPKTSRRSLDKSTTTSTGQPPKEVLSMSSISKTDEMKKSLDKWLEKKLRFPITKIETLDLEKPSDLRRLHNFHRTIMHWGQVKHCADYMRHLHYSMFQSQKHIHPFIPSVEEVESYWGLATSVKSHLASSPATFTTKSHQSEWQTLEDDSRS